MFINLPFYNQILVAAIDIIGIWLAYMIGRTNLKKKLNQIFLGMTFLMFVWVNFAYLARVIGKNQPSLALFFLKTAWFVTPFLFALLYFFVVIYIKKEKKYRYLNWAVLGLAVFVSLITAFTKLVISKIDFIGKTLTIIYGKGMISFLAVILMFMIVSFVLLVKKYFRSSKKRKTRTGYILVGVLVFYLANAVFNIFLPLFLGIYRFYWIGDYSTILFLIFIFYAIVKQELFNIKVALTTIFIGIIAILILADALIFTEELYLQVTRMIIFIALIFFGRSLIRSVNLEIRRKEELQRLAQELKRVNIKLKKLDKAKSEFISIASHQLRTPLTAMKGYLSMILEGRYGKLNKKIKKKMKNVYASNERLTELVNTLLDISRIETGKIDIKKEEVSIIDIIKSVLEELKIQADKKNLYLKFKKSKKGLPEIFVDREKTRQVLLNLIDNAIRYTEKGGVTVKAKKKSKDKVRILIKDTGMGMTKDEQKNLFTRFARGAAGEMSYTEGTGLGLYITRRFLELNGGKVWVKSKGRGNGSTFYIELPVK